jgi:hypothetical protein
MISFVSDSGFAFSPTSHYEASTIEGFLSELRKGQEDQYWSILKSANEFNFQEPPTEVSVKPFVPEGSSRYWIVPSRVHPAYDDFQKWLQYLEEATKTKNAEVIIKQRTAGTGEWRPCLMPFWRPSKRYFIEMYVNGVKTK